MMTKIRYDYNFLQQFCKENGIILTKDYSLEKVNRETIIEAKCLTERCEDICSKGFRQFIKVGCYCKKHTEENRQNKIKETNLEKYGVEHSLQSKEVREKGKQTNLEKYGVENPFQSEDIKEKIKATNLEKYGCENPSQSQDIKNKKIETCIKHFSVQHPAQSEEVKQKIKETNLEKYGVEHSLQSKEVREKGKQTNLEKYGVENPFQSEDIKEKIKATNLEKYGCENPSQSQDIKNKKIETCIKHFSVQNPAQSNEVREKSKQTCLEKYGCENPQQNAGISEKSSKNAYKAYDYVFPSGRVERIQGYERFMLNDLLQKEDVLEHDIVVNRSEVPSVWYEDANGKKRRYFVDCFIKSQNRCIETKSTWTAVKNKDCIYLKQQALKDAGYKCEIWIYNDKGEIMEKVN